MKRKIKWNRVIKALVILAITVLAIYSIITLVTVQTVIHTPAGDYTCNGSFLKVCSGSNAVATYLGV